MQILIDRLHGDKDYRCLMERDEDKKTALDYLIQTDHQIACDPIVYLVKKLPDAMRNAMILDYIHVLTKTKTSCSHEIIKAGQLKRSSKNWINATVCHTKRLSIAEFF